MVAPPRAEPTASPFAPPVVDELLRHRLVELLEQRWAVQVVLLEAPGGFGKTVSLAQSYHRNLFDQRGVDLYVSCGPAERDSLRLAQVIADQLSLTLPRFLGGAGELAGLIAAGLAHLGPSPVCLVLDDAHHLRGTESAALLADLVRMLPSNVHLLLSGRQLPDLPLARLDAAERVLRVGEKELCFTPEELSRLAERHGVDSSHLEATGGWPALACLSLAVDRSAPMDFLLQEVVQGLDPDDRRTLAATALMGRTDEASLAAVMGFAPDTERFARRVPLVTRWPDGSVHAHDLWSLVLRELLGREEFGHLAITVSGHQLDAGSHDDALETALVVRAWAPARAAVVAALQSADRVLDASTAQRWLDAFPPSQRDEAELRLLECTMHRMSGDLDAAVVAAEAALNCAAERQEPEWEGLAALELGTVSWLTDDLARLLDVLAISERLELVGVDSLRWMLDLAGAGMADLSGDPAEALRLVEQIDVEAVPPRVAQLVLRWRCVLPVLLGDSELAVAHAAVLADRDPGEMTTMLVAATHWQHGDPEPLREVFGAGEDSALFEIAQDDFLIGTYGAVIGASLGLVRPVDHLEPLASGRSRDRALLHLARAAAAVAAGDQDGACSEVEALIGPDGTEDPVIWGELARSITLSAPLSVRVVDRLASADLGPSLCRRRHLSALFLDARRGSEVDWDLVPPPASVMTGLPLRWSVELAARAASIGRLDVSDPLATYLFDYVGDAVHQQLDELEQSALVAAVGVDRVRARLPERDRPVVVVSACGPMLVNGSGSGHGNLRRVRVRELLGLLVLRERVTVRYAIEALWPGSDESRGRKNLRMTVFYLRQLLEPDRPKGSPPQLLRRDGDELHLARSSALVLDVWEIRRHLQRGRELERLGNLADAVAEFHSAVGLWSGEVLPDLREHHSMSTEVTLVDRQLADAAAQVAEWAVATDDSMTAVAVAERLLRHDPYDERAHSVVIGVWLDRGDLSEAGTALERCRSALAELGVDPAPGTQLLERRVERLARRVPSSAADARHGRPSD